MHTSHNRQSAFLKMKRDKYFSFNKRYNLTLVVFELNANVTEILFLNHMVVYFFVPSINYIPRLTFYG